MLRLVGVFVAFILGASMASANGLFDPEEETLRVPALEAEATAPSNMRPTDLNWPARFCAYDGKLYSVGARICVNAHLMLACQREDSSQDARWEEENSASCNDAEPAAPEES
jgi:hypothetical protein